MSTTAFLVLPALLIACLLLAAGGWLLVHMRRQSQATERRLARLEFRNRMARNDSTMPHPLKGLPVGSLLNDFELARLDGSGTMRLSDLRGQRSTVIFASSTCRGSHELAAALARGSIAGFAPVLVIDAEASVDGFATIPAGIPVLEQRHYELSRIWVAHLTPSAYLIDERGRTLSRLLAGPRSIAAALSIPGADQLTDDHSRIPQSSDAVPHSPSPGARVSLPPLTDVSGESIHLTSQMSGSAVVMFTDPNCRACDPLPALLRELTSRERVIVIARADRETTTKLRRSLPPDATLVADPLGDIGRACGVVATPAALYVSSKGVLERPPAIGATAIAGLLTEVRAAEVGT